MMTETTEQSLQFTPEQKTVVDLILEEAERAGFGHVLKEEVADRVRIILKGDEHPLWRVSFEAHPDGRTWYECEGSDEGRRWWLVPGRPPRRDQIRIHVARAALYLRVAGKVAE